MRADVKLALRLADLADSITVARLEDSALSAWAKADRTLVTELDLTVERELRAVLAAERPLDAILGEELGGQRDAGAERVWLIDPIDGTEGLVRGLPVWATLIALQVGGRSVLGVISAPALGRRWWAGRGHGAWQGRTVRGRPAGHPVRMAVSGLDTLSDAHLSASGIWNWAEWGRFHGFVDLARQVRRTRGFGDFLSHVLVAQGAVDLSCEPHLSPWDMAAFVPLVEEAGGRCTDLDGNYPSASGLLCSNGLLHGTALAVLNRNENNLHLAIDRTVMND